MTAGYGEWTNSGRMPHPLELARRLGKPFSNENETERLVQYFAQDVYWYNFMIEQARPKPTSQNA